MVSIVGAILKLHDAVSPGKISALTISILMAITLLAALNGIGKAKLFGLSVVGLSATAAKKIFPVLVFASRTSAGSFPMSVQTQTTRLCTSQGIANFASSFGSSIGQNGCAGIYPAMLAVMIAPTVGIDPMTLHFILLLLGVIAIGSVGVAGVGVGGGATFAALIVLSTMDLPVTLAGLLISIEPLIDMGRTALNVSGSITAGTLTSRLLGQTDMAIFNSDSEISLDEEPQTAGVDLTCNYDAVLLQLGLRRLRDD